MQTLNLKASAAKRLAENILKQLDRNRDTDRVEIRCGDPEGEPTGWKEFSILCITREVAY